MTIIPVEQSPTDTILPLKLVIFYTHRVHWRYAEVESLTDSFINVMNLNHIWKQQNRLIKT